MKLIGVISKQHDSRSSGKATSSNTSIPVDESKVSLRSNHVKLDHELTIIGTILRSNFLINLCSSASSTTLVGITTSSTLSSPAFVVGDEVPDSLAIGADCTTSLRKKPMAYKCCGE